MTTIQGQLREAHDEIERLRAEIERLRALLREALPELRGELWQESRICGSCYQYDGHRPDCLVKRIEEVLK